MKIQSFTPSLMKKYIRKIGGSNCGCNRNCITISKVAGNKESLVFMAKLVKITEQVFGAGLSLDSVSTNYGHVAIRYPEYKKNKEICTLLVKCTNSIGAKHERYIKRLKEYKNRNINE